MFNIGGNEYRFAAVVKYEYQVVYVRFIGTHGEYDAIDTTNV